MKVGLVLNGEPPGEEDLAELDGMDEVVCADGGANAVLRSGRAPTWVVGDLDSFDPALRAQAERWEVRFEELPRAKDSTDGERALARALALGATEVLILGAHGGRAAMFLANLALLRRCRAAGVAAELRGRGEAVRYLGAGERWALAGRVGDGLDLLPEGGPAVVSLQGTAYDHARVRLEADGARGVSNAVRADPAEVAVHEGLVLVVVSRRGG